MDLMTSEERRPLRPRPQDGDHARIDEAANDGEPNSLRIPRIVAYCGLAYAAVVTLALIACIVALLIPTSQRADEGRRPAFPPSAGPPSSSPPSHQTLRSPPSSPPTSRSSPSSSSPPSSSVSNFLVLADLHLEPHYNATEPQSDTRICRDAAHSSSCETADWELPPPPRSLSSTSSLNRSSSSHSSSPFRFGRFLCDPPESFLSKALSSLASSLSSSSTSMDFVLLAGDHAAHFIACPLNLYHTIDRAVALVRGAFPSTPLIFTIGNTDVFPTSFLPSPAQARSLSDVTLDTCGAPFKSLLSILFRHGLLAADDEEAVQTFCHGGYYSNVVAHGRVRVLSLNTLAWAKDLPSGLTEEQTVASPPSHSFTTRTSWKDNATTQPIELTPSTLSFSFPSNPPSNLHSPPSLPCSSPARADDPYGQFSFLHEQLHLASRSDPPQHVHIVGHQPPGVKPSASPSSSWCPRYQQRFTEVLARWPHTVQGLMFGDYSQDVVRLLGGVDGAVVHVNPGLSMRKNVNPAARMYQYERHSGRIVDYHQLFVDLTALQLRVGREEGRGEGVGEGEAEVVWAWQYSAREYYQMSEYGVEGWLRVVRRMQSEAELLERYISAVNVWKQGDGDELAYLCDIVALEEADNAECRRSGRVPLPQSK